VGVVPALGLTQILGYGTLYYSFSLLAPGMAGDFGLTVEQVFAVFSASLFVGGISAPFVGRWMDRHGASVVMTFGSGLSAMTLLLCAWAPSMVVFALGVALLQAASSMVLYQAAFAVLVERRPDVASRSIIHLTLIAGFASTIFWPVTASLSQYLSWREIYVAFAGLNFLACLPLHYWIARRRRSESVLSAQQGWKAVEGTLPDHLRWRGMIMVSLAFALQGFALSAILTHMVPLLGNIGFGAAAVMIGSLFGPSQVLSRLISMAFGKNLSPPMLATISAVMTVAGLVVLGLSETWLPGAVAFAVCVGLGSGINSIAQGSLPLWLFGSAGYGAITGRMTAARLAASAMAPFVFSVLMESFGARVALLTTAGLGAVGIAAFIAVVLATRQSVSRASEP
jgi:MFS family permease